MAKANKPASPRKGPGFEREVKTLLELMGYDVKPDQLFRGTQIDMLALKTDAFTTHALIVECADHQEPVGIELVKQKASALLVAPAAGVSARLLYVSRHGFTKTAKEFADSQPGVSLLTLVELEGKLINFAPYASWFCSNYEASSGMFRAGSLHNRYVELAAKDEKGRVAPSLTTYVDDWLDQQDNNLLFVLGEFGSGKTSFCHHFTYSLLRKKYVEHQQGLTPILISLREYRRGFDLKQVITDTLINHYGVALPSFLAFERVCATGKILLILDGFDEMADRASKQALVESFSQIFLLAALDTKTIVTCRSNFFRDHAQLLSLMREFQIEVPQAETTRRIPLSRHGRVVHVERLGPKQIEEYAAQRLGPKAPQAIAAIGRIHDLSDLCTRPVLLDMVVSTLPALESEEKRINSAALYEHYTDQWTTRDEWRVSLPLEHRRAFTESLAWHMYGSDQHSVASGLLDELLLESLANIAKDTDELEVYRNDVQTCSFLVRSGAEVEFRFAHKSFLEYFVARKLVNDIINHTPSKKHLRAGKRSELRARRTPGEPFWISWDSVTGRPVFPDDLPQSDYAFVLNELQRRMFDSNAWISYGKAGARPSTLLDAFSHPNTGIRDAFERVFASAGVLVSRHEWDVSEEIATFAAETLENREASLTLLLSGALPIEVLRVLLEIIRHAKGTEYLSQNADQLASVGTTASDHLARLCAFVALARVPGRANVELVNAARANLSDAALSAFLFELGESPHGAALLRDLWENENIKPLNELICYHGLSKHALPVPSNRKERLEDVLVHMLNSSDDTERALGFAICDTLQMADGQAIGFLGRVFGRITEQEHLRRAASVLRRYDNKKVLKAVMAMAMSERDPDVRKRLKEVEQMLRATVVSNDPADHRHLRRKHEQDARAALWRAMRR